MTIIDTQLHEPTLVRDWRTRDRDLRYEVMAELELGYMNSAGVDAALLFALDQAWGEFVVREHPDRFWLVPMITDDGIGGSKRADSPDIGDFIAAQRANPAVAGIRILHTTSSILHENADRPIYVHPVEHFESVFAACVEHGLPLFMSTAGSLAGAERIATEHPDLTVVIDHMGMPQRPTFVRDTPPFAALDQLLRLATSPNVIVKVSGVPTLSEEAYPYADVWTPLLRLVEVFGPRRLMWGSDISRVHGAAGYELDVPAGRMPYQGKHSYAEALLYLRETDRLDDDQKEWILGRTAQTLIRSTVAAR